MNPNLWTPAMITVLVAAAIDARSRRIPNWLSVPSLVLGVVVSIALDGPAGWNRSLLGIALAAVFFGGQCWLGNMGMGDLKLGCAMGAWIGAPALLFALLITAMAGGLLATGYLLFAARSKSDAHAIPYAPPMAVGVMVSMFANWR